MAYARTTRTRRKAKRAPSRTARRTGGYTRRRSVARRPAKRARRAAGGSRQQRVVIEVIQTPFTENPLADAISERKKEVKARRARI